MTNRTNAAVRKLLASASRYSIEEETSCKQLLTVIDTVAGLGMAVDSERGANFLLANGSEAYLNSSYNGVGSAS